jgi:hypothetical protein
MQHLGLLCLCWFGWSITWQKTSYNDRHTYFAITVVFTSLPKVLFEWGSQLQVGGREQLIPVCFMVNLYTSLLYSKGRGRGASKAVC